MRIGIDVSSLIYQTGVSSYTKNLVEALLEIDKQNEYCLFGGSLRRSGEFKKILNEQSVKYLKTYPIAPTVADLLWNKLHILPIETLIGKVDAFHSSDWTQPPTKAFKVTTIHDLVPLRFPGISHPIIVGVHKRRLKWVKREVDKIIAVSEFTKREIVELLQIDPEKIVVIPEAVDLSVDKVTDTDKERVISKFGIRGKYLLAVGADPRKNIPNLITAFGKVRRKVENLNLVVTGRMWADLPTRPGVIYTGHVTKQDLNCLYSGAEALTYVSTYEGFGLPILEAMRIGCPVVTSNISSMPEVAGDGAILVNPNDVDMIAKGIEEVLKNRKKWIQKGNERVNNFSWEKTAQETLKVYEGAKA